jgi:hypothetical protein
MKGGFLADKSDIISMDSWETDHGLARIQAGRVPEVLTALTTKITLKNGVFWDVTPCGSCKNRRFGGT